MQQIHEQFAEYASHHQTPGNKVCHRFGIPLIMLGLLGMLARVELPAGLDAAIVLIAAVEVYYLILEWRLALVMLLATTVFYFAGSAMPMWSLIAVFVLGWVLQFIGHGVYEKRSPAFFRNLVHLLIGPLWIANDLVPVVRGEKLRAGVRP
jgi:uncharacterized membrane protein YGL010W